MPRLAQLAALTAAGALITCAACSSSPTPFTPTPPGPTEPAPGPTAPVPTAEQPGPGPGPQPGPAPPQNVVDALVQGNSTFAVDLYHQLRKEPGNIAFSSASISESSWRPSSSGVWVAEARALTARRMIRSLRSGMCICWESSCRVGRRP